MDQTNKTVCGDMQQCPPDLPGAALPEEPSRQEGVPLAVCLLLQTFLSGCLCCVTCDAPGCVPWQTETGKTCMDASVNIAMANLTLGMNTLCYGHKHWGYNSIKQWQQTSRWWNLRFVRVVCATIHIMSFQSLNQRLCMVNPGGPELWFCMAEHLKADGLDHALTGSAALALTNILYVLIVVLWIVRCACVVCLTHFTLHPAIMHGGH